MKPWKRIDPTIITKVGHRTIIGKTFVMPDKSIAEFETYDREGRQYVAVIALTPNNLVVTARQFRAGPEKLMYELPGGGVEANESLESAIHRELLEETGYSSSKMQYLGGLHKDEKFNAVHHYFLARDCTVQLVDLQLDLDEHIDVKLYQ